jgi:hypothetical protein
MAPGPRLRNGKTIGSKSAWPILNVLAHHPDMFEWRLGVADHQLGFLGLLVEASKPLPHPVDRSRLKSVGFENRKKIVARFASAEPTRQVH